MDGGKDPSEILNKFGNLVNRTLKFKGLEVLPEGEVDTEIKDVKEAVFDQSSLNTDDLCFYTFSGEKNKASLFYLGGGQH